MAKSWPARNRFSARFGVRLLIVRRRLPIRLLPKLRERSLPAVQLMKSVRFSDPRGWFAETYSERRLAKLGVDLRFVQDNQSFSAQAGTVPRSWEGPLMPGT